MKPPPMAKPFTAAMTGFSRVPSMKGSGIGGRLPPGVPAESDSFMSSPAQKPRPVPVKIATSRSLLRRNSVQVSASAIRISVLSGDDAFEAVHFDLAVEPLAQLIGDF